jgi:hypothetical protein
VVTDYFDPDSGINYTFDLLPEDGRVLRVLRLPWHKIANPPDRAMFDAVGEEPPDDVSSLTDPGGQ